MKKQIWPFIFLSAIFTTFSCKKPVSQKLSTTVIKKLITEKPWKLITYEYDFSSNGLIGNFEERIQDCEKDNIYVFNNNGSGEVWENTTICNGNKPVSPFSPSLANNEMKLDFIDGIATIDQFNKDTLVITDKNMPVGKLITIYGY